MMVYISMPQFHIQFNFIFSLSIVVEVSFHDLKLLIHISEHIQLIYTGIRRTAARGRRPQLVYSQAGQAPPVAAPSLLADSLLYKFITNLQIREVYNEFDTI